MHIHFVVHESFEPPGAFDSWVRDRQHTAGHSPVYAGAPLPQSAEGIDLLVVLGGPQSPTTTTAECPYFDAAAECGLISQCIAAGKAVVGVCLGAQLIGAALGARHAPSPQKEIGNFPITLTEAGRANSKFAHFGDSLEVAHWHSDMPGLTTDAAIIAFSEGCPRQIIEYSDLVYGLQCHLEHTPAVVEQLIAASEHELATLSDHRFVQQPVALRANEHALMNQKLFGFLDCLMVEYGQKR